MPVADDREIAIRCSDVSVSRFGNGPAVRAVDGASFVLPSGGTLAISGPTGSGKTSLAAVLAGARNRTLRICGGEAHVTGIPVRHPGRREHRVLTYRVGYIEQGGASTFPGTQTIGELISEPITSRDRRINQRSLAVRVAALLDEMHLPLGAAAKYPHELSAGMRQRVSFARALILDPRVLIADEPLANIGLEVRHVIFDAIRRRQHQWQMATLLVSNDRDLIRELKAERVVLRNGHVVATGTADTLDWTPGIGAARSLIVAA